MANALPSYGYAGGDWGATFRPITDSAAARYRVPRELLDAIVAPKGYDPMLIRRAPLIGGSLQNTGKIIVDTAQKLADFGKQYGGDFGAATAALWGYDADEIAAGMLSPEVASILQRARVPNSAQAAVDAENRLSENEDANVWDVSDKAIWRWSMQDWSNFFKNSTIKITLVVIGILIIVFSVYALIMKGRMTTRTFVKGINAGV